MKTEVSDRKRRGGFYTPPSLVELALARALEGSQGRVRALEPSAGDGAFLRGLARVRPDAEVCAVEREPGEAEACRAANPAARVYARSFFDWAEESGERFNLLVGNPPFLRYQHIPKSDRAAAERLCAALGFPLGGVANLWVPFVVVGLSRLEENGRFALVIPEELFFGVSAGAARAALLELAGELRVDRVSRRAFPELLQDVIVLSGRRMRGAARRILLAEPGLAPVSASLPPGGAPWTGALLPPAAAEALERALGLPGVRALGEIARFSVATVTGANAWFGVNERTLNARGLGPWGRPLLTHAAPGLRFGPEDFEALRRSDAPAWLLDFGRNPPAEMALPYIAGGEAAGLHLRFKCRVRSPWYAVPVVPPGAILLPKRAHLHHRMALNGAGVVTTDTLYRGEMKVGEAADLVASFHNSLSLLGAELHGRSYGGGVLELVPSEVAKLPVPLCPLGGELARLDALARAGGELVAETDALVAARIPAFGELLPALRLGRERLLGLRL